MNIWTILEIEETRDAASIKQAYARKLKIYKPEVDPNGFKLLREAFEIATKYANGHQVEFEINSDTSQQSHTNTKQSPEYHDKNSISNPSSAVFSLLDILIEDEDRAIDSLNTLLKSDDFVNLEYSEQFQKILSLNLLKFPGRHHKFILHAINEFKWHDQLDMVNADALHNIAITNLINATHSRRMLDKLIYYSQIPNKKTAKQLEVDWPICYAAKILLNKPNYLKFTLIHAFRLKMSQTIRGLVKEIEQNYPEFIGSGLNVMSYLWWSDHRKNIWTNVPQLLFCVVITIILTTILANDSYQYHKNYDANKQTVFISKKGSQNLSTTGLDPALIRTLNESKDLAS